jgi:flagellin-like protein
MLRRILKQKRYFKNIYKEQKGITGLETAIILIAFVVVAAVFAYTVLSAGLFSTQKSQEAVYNGLQETQNTLEVKGAVLAEAIKFKNSCDDETTMTAGTNVTQSQETTTVHEGTGSISDVCAATNGNIAISAATTTVASGDTVTFWAKLSATTALVNFGLSATTTLSAGTDNDTLDAADTNWTKYTFKTTGAGARYYGLFSTAGYTGTVIIDDIEVNNASEWLSTDAWSPYASKVMMVLSLPLGGQSIDFTSGTTQTGGVFSGTKSNKLVVNYNDTVTHISDVYWTKAFIGNNNVDSMLDPGEKVQITIYLDAINAVGTVGVNHQFTLELKSPKGAILSLQRTLPARLYGINNLN